MASRGSERWWFDNWGQPCKGTRVKVTINGHQFSVDVRSKPAWEAFEKVRARHGYDVHDPYPDGDSGTFNCRHIGGDSDRPWSSHAWAAALDSNWLTNPDGNRLRTDMPKAMRDELQALKTAKSGLRVLRWGGDWDRDPRTGHSYFDAMHWELHVSPSELAEGIVDPHDEEDPFMALTDAEQQKLYDTTLSNEARLEALEKVVGRLYGPNKTVTAALYEYRGEEYKEATDLIEAKVVAEVNKAKEEILAAIRDGV